jgi:hypothetical protein
MEGDAAEEAMQQTKQLIAGVSRPSCRRQRRESARCLCRYARRRTTASTSKPPYAILPAYPRVSGSARNELHRYGEGDW